MAKQNRILKAMYAIVQEQESKTGWPIGAAAIVTQTPGLSLGEVEQEIRDLQYKELVQLDHAPDMTLICRFTENGLKEAEKASKD